LHTQIERQSLEYTEFTGFEGDSKAVVSLNQGGELCSLVFEKIQILADLQSSYYQDNAIKGLVYNKKFTCIHNAISSDFSSVILQYMHGVESQCFPFKFNLELNYTLNKNGINLSVKIVNEDEKPFPFTLGWYPYFNSEDLNSGSINFKSNTKYLFDPQQVISGKTSLDVEMPFELKSSKLDDSYESETNEFESLALEDSFKITAPSKENFLKLIYQMNPMLLLMSE
jgi:aldose 1-epimerase